MSHDKIRVTLSRGHTFTKSPELEDDRATGFDQCSGLGLVIPLLSEVEIESPGRL